MELGYRVSLSPDSVGRKAQGPGRQPGIVSRGLMTFFRFMRAYLALGFMGLVLLLSDVVMRFGLAPLVRGRPGRRRRLLTWWGRAMARSVTKPLHLLGVVSIHDPPRVSGEGGTLLVMNHQSLFDIPILFLAARDNYVRIVTRRRYAHRIPVISQMVRIYQYPVVEPGGTSREKRRSLAELRRAARMDDAPLAIFPEGSRTTDGEIGEFRTGGLRWILRARPWKVHMLVVDGLWRGATARQLLTVPGGLCATVRHAGVLDWPDPRADSEPFVAEMRRRMTVTLAAMRGDTR